MDTKENTCFDRHFGCAIIEWGIENYFMETCKKKWSLYSPVFTVRGNQATKWRLNFRGTRMKDESFASVYLERSELDSFSQKVRVNWRLIYPWVNQYMSDCKFIFNRKSSFGMAVRDFESLERKLYSTSSSTFTIQCFMIVYDGEKKDYQSLDPGLKNLSQDLAVACRLEDQCDVAMNIDSLNVEAHKALLYSRIKKLRGEIPLDNNVKNVIPLPDFDVEATKKVLAYLYTANLEYVLRIPSFQIKECIDFFEVKELESYYKFDELHVCTQIGMEEYRLDWLINCTRATEESCVISNILKIKMRDLTFQFHLYMKGLNGDGDYMSIFMEKLKGDWPEFFCVEFSIKDPFGFLHFQQRLRWTSDYGNIQGLENFVLMKFVDNDTLVWLGSLCICCKICFPTYSENISKVKTVVQCHPNLSVESHYELLSNDIAYLFETGKFSNFTILCGETEFQVHKFIISARSYKFKEGIKADYKLKKAICTTSDGLEPEVLRKVISYMYSGRLKKYELQDIIKIYAAAEWLFMLPLKYACTNILRDYIQTMNLDKILSTADRAQDFKLKLLAFKHVCKNTKQVIEILRNSKISNEDLIKECLKFVSCYEITNSEQNCQVDSEIMNANCTLRQIN